MTEETRTFVRATLTYSVLAVAISVVLYFVTGAW